MGQNIIYNDESLSYDEVCDRFSYVRDEDTLDEDFTESRETSSYVSQYTKEEIETMLKDCISSMVDELERKVSAKCANVEYKFNKEINSWNQTLATMRSYRNTIELKLTNDFVCDSVNDINYIYITLYRNGKGLFTECVECIREEYEDTGTAFVPINENELCFKDLDRKEFINRIMAELR